MATNPNSPDKRKPKTRNQGKESDGMRRGTLILVTGPSGAGKDTLLNGVRADLSSDGRVVFARRVITRPSSAGGEAHTSVSELEFHRLKAAGEFWADWQAHDLYYALPKELHLQLQQGISVIANVSRTMTGPLSQLWPQSVEIEIFAPHSQVSQRLNRRGRETPEQISKRLQRSVASSAQSMTRIRVANDATVDEGISRFHQTIISILNQNGDIR